MNYDGGFTGMMPTNINSGGGTGGLPSADPPRVIHSVALKEVPYEGFDGEQHTELYYCPGQAAVSREEFVDYLKRQRPHKAKRPRLRRAIMSVADALIIVEGIVNRFAMWAGGDGGPDDSPIPGE